jgi:membrane-associated phospholipid phosphatase
MVYVSGLMSRNPKLQRTGLLVVSSLMLNDLVTSKLKKEFQRRRPDEANHNFYFEGAEGGRHYASFPSAHTSTAFAFATSVATVFHDHKWVPPVAYSAAALVGLSRIHDNKHWTTDVLAGATVGFVTAKGTNFILKQVEDQLMKRKVNIYVLPNMANGTTGLSFGGSF